jgi:hypothetical protein
MSIEGEVYYRAKVAGLSGVAVFEISSNSGEIPATKVRETIYKEISELVRENLLIFLDKNRTQSLWYWVKRDGTKLYPRAHVYSKLEPCDLLLSKISALRVGIEELEDVSVIDIAERLQVGFDVERVTKKFFEQFKLQHTALLDISSGIQGIDNEADRRWYASIVLNRLMFVYFLQRKGFINNGETLYLQNKLNESQQRGTDLFYSQFLPALFFEGFGKPQYERDSNIQGLIGDVKYLNGGLFLQHQIEQKYPNIAISDAGFEQIFDLFARYSWNLNDTPEGSENEINPAVLGYIFEKYINQKAFGAYYTRPEITEYLCDRTINKLILDRVNQSRVYQFESITELLTRLDANICRSLLDDILPNLSLLDPACGSGAFLIAAMKTLIYVYSAVIGKVKFLTDSKLKTWLEGIEKEHSSLNYYIKKRIITDNLYGVDIMEEATEIAKLRLFLALVSSAYDVSELEPLPNIDFNIMAGNSLIGLINIDENSFNAAGKYVQGNLLQPLLAAKYKEILEHKNKSIELYKKHSFQLKEQQGISQESCLLQLRCDIERVNRESQTKLNALLLTEFSNHLKIRYEEVQLTGKSNKRVLTVDDIAALKPFHWGYHFDEVLARGGFDAIITNPPWEIFKPYAREFFLQHNDLVRKSKMDIKAFEKEQKNLLKDPKIATAWLEYLNQFPYVSAFYRSAEQYKNQISLINGKKAGTDINLYKLFLEQSFNLLRTGGRCGIILPSGTYTDLGTKQLREMLFSQTGLDTIFGLSNERFIFEGVDHRFKFSLLTFEKGGTTNSFMAAFRINPQEAIRVNQLDTFLNNKNEKVEIFVPLIRRLSPDSLSIMEFKNEADIRIAEKMFQFPLLGQKIDTKWNLRLTREFDMTNDSHLFKQELSKVSLVLYEGKMIHQFTHTWAVPRYWVEEQEGRKALLGRNESDKSQILDYQHYRLCFRSVASSTNERSLISSIVPKFVLCGNSLLVSLRYSEDNQVNINNLEMLFSAAIFNSFVIDYCLRQKVSTNLNMFFVYQLPVPRLTKSDRIFNEIVERAAKLICTTPEFDELAQEVGLNSHQQGVTDDTERAKLRAELDGIIANLYGLTEDEFAYILTTFPIVSDTVKQAALAAYKVHQFGWH